MRVIQSTGHYLASAARMAVVGALLAVAAVAQARLQARFDIAQPRSVALLAAPLDSLPKKLGEWVGQTEEIADAALYAEEHLYRRYVHPGSKQRVYAWISFSEQGEDRGHHPEVCMAVAGKQEDENARRELSVPPHAAPIQEYKFTGTDGELRTFYWNYAAPVDSDSALDALARLYHRTRTRAPSLTIEVLARGGPAVNVEQVRQFVRLLDEAMQPMLTDRAVRRNRRLPVSIIRPEPLASASPPVGRYSSGTRVD